MTHSYSVDGFGNRDDIALGNSKSEDTKIENFYNSFGKPLPTIEIADVDAAFTAMIRNSIQAAFESGKQSKCIGFREEDWIGGDALDELLQDFPIDIEWENYGERNSGKYDIVFSWDTDPETIIAW